MITKARSFAKKIVDQGYNIVPLFPYSKNNQDINWQIENTLLMMS